ncbi:hypothetical protein N566_09870 [Streptomycetaceae bacterium MP113-05]|nr:hypothetical protein N566_09870 [Streptomycetaceae bacterium MP113-05]
MAEIIQRTGTWTFDGDTLRIVPGSGKAVHQLRRDLGEVAVPLGAVAGIAYEAGHGRKPGRLRLRLRAGADPLAQVANGRLADAADPYQLAVDADRSGVARYFVDEVRHALLLEQVPDGPCDRYLLAGPSVPRTAPGSDGTAVFDGERVQLEWSWTAEESKSSGGARTLMLDELSGVEWAPAVGLKNGSLRFRPRGTHASQKPEHDPHCVSLWGVRQARETSGAVLLAAAVTARLPHAGAPTALSEGVPGAPPALVESAPEGADHDALLRRLRELSELHREGVLTDEEFAATKRAVLDRF